MLGRETDRLSPVIRASISRPRSLKPAPSDAHRQPAVSEIPDEWGDFGVHLQQLSALWNGQELQQTSAERSSHAQSSPLSQLGSTFFTPEDGQDYLAAVMPRSISLSRGIDQSRDHSGMSADAILARAALP